MRVKLASNPDTTAPLLRALAWDPSVTVRAAVALNPSLPEDAERALAGDADERVRSVLAAKLAGMIPSLTREGRAELLDRAVRTLIGLVATETERVRGVIAEVVKDMPEAPRMLILPLARDAAVQVSEPILRLSPVLTEADLLELLSHPPNRMAPAAIASRPGLMARVADAISGGPDTAAVAVLLANSSAQLREAALDTLVERAPEEPSWHEPLVRRPTLSTRAVLALARFVTDHLLDMLARRADLDSATREELGRRVEERLGRERRSFPAARTSMADALAEARLLKAKDRLDEACMRTASAQGDPVRCLAMLAVAADLAPATVQRAAALRNAKAVVSLVWLAGFSVEIATSLQTLVALTPPSALLRGGPRGQFPLTPEEMRLQLDMLRRGDG